MTDFNLNKKIITCSILVLAGAGLNNFFVIPLYANLELHFGTICTVLSLYLLGLRWTIPVSVLISLSLGFNWDNWFTPCLLLAEIIFIGLCVKKFCPVIYADLFFWLLIGMPATAIVFYLINPTGSDFLLSTVLKQSINGLLYVSIAAVMLPFIPSKWYLTKQKKSLPKMRQIIQNKLVSAIIGTSMIVGITASEYSVRKQEPIVNDSLNWHAKEAANFTEDYLHYHQIIIKALAELASREQTNQAQLKTAVQIFQSASQGFISMLVTDVAGKVILAAPASFDQLLKSQQSDMSVSDRDYFIEAMSNRKLYVSQVFLGRGFGSDMIVAISAPKFQPNKNDPIGIVEGSLDLSELNRIDDNAISNNSSIVLVDSNNRVIFSSEILKLKALSKFQLEKTKRNYKTIIPMAHFSFGQNNSDMFYQMHQLNNHWRVFVLQSPKYLIKEFEKYYVFILLLALVFAIFSHYLSRYIAAFIATPIEEITNLFSKPNATDAYKIHQEQSMTFEALRLFESLKASQELQLSFQKNLEDKVSLQTRQLSDTNKELEKATQKAQQSNRLKSEFLANMSHEIRTPMNGVIGMINLLKNSPLDHDQSHKLKLAKSSADSLLLLINDILDLSKIESGKLELESIEFNLHDLLSELVSALAYVAQQKGLEVILDVSAVENTQVKGDPGRLRQVITNLFSNATKFTEQGEILITATSSSGTLNKVNFSCEVSDSGIGIPKDKIAHLFESFSQVDASTTRKYGGTGLGLTISRRICKLMSGTINVASNHGKGSQFTVEVMLERGISNISEDKMSSIKSMNILIVDQNTKSRKALKNQLCKWGAQVVEANSYAQAAEICDTASQQKNVPQLDMGFINYHLNEISVSSLAQTFLTSSTYSELPLVLMKPAVSEESFLAEHQTEFVAVINKPILISELSLLVNTIIRHKNNRPELLNALLTQNSRLDNHQLSELEKNKTKNIEIQTENSIQRKERWPADSKILLVEDNMINQEVVLGILESFELVADVANDGRQAIEKLSETEGVSNYSIVLMDCQMPILDGYETTKQIRAGKAGENNKAIPIIAMTANAMEGDKEKCFQAGMDDYLAKPIETDDFYQCLHRWLDKKSPPKRAIGQNLPDRNNAIPEDKKLVWNYQQAFKRMMKKEDLLIKVVTIYLTNANSAICSLKESIDENDLQNIKEKSHMIKGMAANLSAEILSDRAFQIEQLVELDELSKLPDLFYSLHADHEQLLKQLTEYLYKNSID